MIVKPMQKTMIRVAAVAMGCIVLASGSPFSMAQGPQPYPDPVAAEKAAVLVEDFFRLGFDPKGISEDDVDQYGVDRFADYLSSIVDSPFWVVPQQYEVQNVYKIYNTDSAAIVTSRTLTDSLPYFGLVEVDWVWFLRQIDGGEWRISDVRRTNGLLKAVNMIRFIDTTSVFPERIKPDIVREESTLLLSNRQIREEFAKNRPVLDQLVGLLVDNDSIKFIERTGERVSQFNFTMIDWGMASQDVPQDVLEEYLANASPEEKEMMESRLRAAEKQRAEGKRMVKNLAKKASVDPETIESAIAMMKKTRVSFVNTVLQWDGAMLLTLAGKVNDVTGFLYSPKGEVPLISPEEYFYLEDLGGGWWLFRAT